MTYRHQTVVGATCIVDVPEAFNASNVSNVTVHYHMNHCIRSIYRVTIELLETHGLFLTWWKYGSTNTVLVTFKLQYY